MILFRLLLLFFLIYLLLRFLGRVLFGMSQAKQRQYNTGQQNAYSNKKKEGDVTVNTQAKTPSKRFDKNDGEYVKFEEVDE